jgi:CelD/BcsL family acetyltransferase involved in cellulose biosynthesis
MARCPDPHPFQTVEWQRAWWETFGTGELAVLPIFGDGGEPAAVAALGRDTSGVVRFVGSGELTDYPGPAVAPGATELTARSVIDRLVGQPSRWTELDVRDSRPQDGLIDALRRVAHERQLRTTSSPDEPVAVISLPSTWDDFLRAQTRHCRHELRRKLSRFERERPAAALRSSDAGSLAADLETFLALHRRSTGAKGQFLTPDVEAFFRRIAFDFMSLESLRLDLLEDRGRALAATLGFQSETTYYLYNMAFDPAGRVVSPGIVLLAMLIGRAIGDRLACFDLLRGLERYKLELGAVPRQLMRLRVHAA